MIYRPAIQTLCLLSLSFVLGCCGNGWNGYSQPAYPIGPYPGTNYPAPPYGTYPPPAGVTATPPGTVSGMPPVTGTLQTYSQPLPNAIPPTGYGQGYLQPGVPLNQFSPPQPFFGR